jgi:hypothetical protein
MQAKDNVLESVAEAASAPKKSRLGAKLINKMREDNKREERKEL